MIREGPDKGPSHNNLLSGKSPAVRRPLKFKSALLFLELVNFPLKIIDSLYCLADTSFTGCCFNIQSAQHAICHLGYGHFSALP